MRTLPVFAATLALSLIGTAAALASPAIPHPPLASNEMIATVDWHPSTRHWDHHFHAHQDSLRTHQPTVAERRIHRMMRRADPHARYAVEAAPRYRLGSQD